MEDHKGIPSTHKQLSELQANALARMVAGSKVSPDEKAELALLILQVHWASDSDRDLVLGVVKPDAKDLPPTKKTMHAGLLDAASLFHNGAVGCSDGRERHTRRQADRLAAARYVPWHEVANRGQHEVADKPLDSRQHGWPFAGSLGHRR